jgi:hypothetical protein
MSSYYPAKAGQGTFRSAVFSITSKGDRMEEKEKLSIMLEHWIEHNQSHIGEYQKWVERAAVLGLDLVKAEIEGAIKKLLLVNQHLETARSRLASSSLE